MNQGPLTRISFQGSCCIIFNFSRWLYNTCHYCTINTSSRWVCRYVILPPVPATGYTLGISFKLSYSWQACPSVTQRSVPPPTRGKTIGGLSFGGVQQGSALGSVSSGMCKLILTSHPHQQVLTSLRRHRKTNPKTTDLIRWCDIRTFFFYYKTC